MLTTTSHHIEGKRIKEYVGIVTGETIAGINVFRDFFAGIRDVFGGRSRAYEKEVGRSRRIALKEMVERAESMGADAVIGVDFDYESLGKGGMLMVSVSGTAVKLTNKDTLDGDIQLA